jgi:excinuclease UvrABC helicase subunit UvrB
MSEEKNTITLAEAIHWTARWRKKAGDFNKHHELYGFVIPKKDLQEILTEDVDAVRAYIGMDDENNGKLILVGAKYDDTEIDMLSDMLPEKSWFRGNIYDFTRPCPPACDYESPLN